eukprot:CAMPEP_0185038268 /NCGR_PEP_ID=MMETSP1103-20130426/33699_1 /TAXON_ID=36769 /ORGANISM="Paraphysomonas bandaiensis, Strain Caron Lab Isolate" /LENGTH=128 /DNA_ID=CAMNT_0027576621 /DNA_START=41 /DNA_END=424 /DNA_ORIENTATION=+
MKRRRITEQQMGFGYACRGSIPSLLNDLEERGVLCIAEETFLDIGAGSGDILQDVQSECRHTWGVEMNLEWFDKTPEIWKSRIKWCKLEDVDVAECCDMASTSIAYMYDLCLKRLSRRALSYEEDPHW